MSVRQEKMLDNVYKLFMVIMMSTCGFFLMRLVNTLDKAVEDVEKLKTEQAVMRSEMSTLMKK